MAADMTALEALRREAGLTYDQVAQRTGLSKGQVWRIITGRTNGRDAAAAKRIRGFLRSQVKPKSSDPDFLAKIRQVAVPFLEQRLAARGGTVTR